MWKFISLVLNLILGGGFIGTVATLKSERKKQEANAKLSELTTIEKGTEILMENIVSPLRKELNAVRKEITRLRKAIDKANTCVYSASCPVRQQLQVDTADDAEPDAKEG